VLLFLLESSGLRRVRTVDREDTLKLGFFLLILVLHLHNQVVLLLNLSDVVLKIPEQLLYSQSLLLVGGVGASQDNCRVVVKMCDLRQFASDGSGVNWSFFGIAFYSWFKTE